MPKRLYFATIVIVILILFNVFFILKSENFNALQNAEPYESLVLGDNLRRDTQAFILPVSEASYLPILDTNITPPSLDAKTAMVYDVNSTKILYAKNIEEKLPIASLTKLLTGVVVLEKLNLKDIVSIPQEALKVDGQKQDLYLGERLIVEDLLKMMLIKSSNDAAYALIHHAKVNNIDLIEEMNKKAQSIGMHDSHFKDAAGLNDEAYSNADDMIKLVNYSLGQQKLWDFMSQSSTTIISLDGIEHNIQSTNQLLDQIPGILGGKTGYTENALGCMVLVVQIPNKNDKIISIILGSRERFTDTKKLVEWTKQAYTW